MASTSPRDSRSRAGRASGRGPTSTGRAATGRAMGGRGVSGGAGARPGSRANPRAQTRPAPRAATPQTSERARSRFTGRAAVLVLVVAVLVVSYASSMRAYLRQQQHLTALHTNIHHAKSRIAALQREKERWRDPHYVRVQARARFGWVMPGEVGFQVIGENGKLLDNPDALPSDRHTATAQQPTWWQSAWGSVVAAGDPPQPRNPADRPTPTMKIRLH